MNEGTGSIVADLSPTKAHGELNASASWVAGGINTTDNNGVYVGQWHTTFATTPTNITIHSVAKRVSGTGTGAYTIAAADITGTHRAFQFRVNNHKAEYIPFIGSTPYTVTGTTSIPVGETFSMTGTYDGESAEIYLNGVYENQNTSPSGDLDTNEQAYFGFGGRYTSLSNINEDWLGDINLVYIYDRALSATEIAQLHADPYQIFDQPDLGFLSVPEASTDVIVPIYDATNGTWKEKPKQWGNQSDVQSALFHNAERIGIDPESIVLAMPLWDKKATEYSKNVATTSIVGATFTQDKFNFSTGNDYITTDVLPSVGSAGDDITCVAIASHAQNAIGTIVGDENFSRSFQLRYDADHKLTFNSAGNENILTSSVAVEDYANDRVLAVSYTPSGDCVLYDNGKVIGTGNNTNTFDNNTAFRLGIKATSSEDLVGTISSVFIVSAILTADQIAELSDNPYQLWQPRTPTFYSFAEEAGTAYTLTADGGTFTTTGTAADLLRGYKTTASTGAFAVTGTSADLLRGYKIPVDSGTFSTTGTSADLLRGYKLPAASGTFSFTGTAASLLLGRKITASSGSFAVTGTAAGLLYGRLLSAESGTFSFTGTAATLTYTPAAGGYTITADPGTFTVTGTAASLLRGRKLTAESGSFLVTGQDADLLRGYLLTAGGGTFTVTGTAADLLRGYHLDAGSGTYTFTGTAATLSYSGITIPVGMASVTFTSSKPTATFTSSKPTATFTASKPTVNFS